MGSKTSFYISGDLENILSRHVAKHGSISKAVHFALASLDAMYRAERSALRKLFSRNEINLMLNRALSTSYTPDGIINRVLWSTEDEAQSVFGYYDVDREAILGKLQGLAISQQYALVDWLMELRGPEPLASDDSHSICATKDGKYYMLELSNDDTEIVHKSGEMRDNPERWYLFIRASEEAGGGKALAEIQPEPGAWPDIRELAELNGFEPVPARAFSGGR